MYNVGTLWNSKNDLSYNCKIYIYSHQFYILQEEIKFQLKQRVIIDQMMLYILCFTQEVDQVWMV